jgi:hypothetical protein
MRYDDLLAAWRHLQRNPAFTVLAAAALALGLTATIAAFCLVSAVMLAPLPYPDAARLWVPHLTMAAPGRGAPEPSRFSYREFEAFRRSQDVFDRPARRALRLDPAASLRHE